MLLSKWRQITAALTQRTYGSNGIGPNDARQHNIQQLVTKLDTVLGAFAEQANSKERLQNLEELVKRGARFGYTLFSQPTTWELDWDSGAAGKGGNVVVYPALVQVGDDEGRRLSRPHRATDAQSVPVDVKI
jgi:hypothetical protein